MLSVTVQSSLPQVLQRGKWRRTQAAMAARAAAEGVGDPISGLPRERRRRPRRSARVQARPVVHGRGRADGAQGRFAATDPRVFRLGSFGAEGYHVACLPVHGRGHHRGSRVFLSLRFLCPRRPSNNLYFCACSL